jgi:ribosome-binding factor A
VRLNRINDEIKKEAAIIIHELKDPRLAALITVTSVNTTNDLKQCKIYVAIMGDEKEKKETFDALSRSAGFIRKEIAHNINLRNTPEIRFIEDDSLEYGLKMEKLLDSVK